MLTIDRYKQSEMIVMTMEEMVPDTSLFRKIDATIDFTFIYEEVKDYYCLDNGRPSLDPVILFKLVFIQTLDGLKSMRQTCEKIKVDAEYRWFLGIPFGEATPHFSTFSKNYERRFKDSDVFETIFTEIVHQAIDYGLVSGEILYTDSTHKKANANKNKFKESIQEVIKKRRHWLEEEINEERQRCGRKSYEYQDQVETKQVKLSTTDEESGYYFRSHKEKGFMYLDHRTVDDQCNIIVDCHITKGNVHDSQPYIHRLKAIKKTFDFDIQAVGLDSGYQSLDIKKYLNDHGIIGIIGSRRTGTKASRAKNRQFDYDSKNDLYIHKKTGEVLKYTGNIDRNGYKKYSNLEKDITLTRHLKADLNDHYNKLRVSDQGKSIYKRRKETIERSFADSKQNHGYRYAMVKGLKKNQHYTWLICAAQNMKNIALKKEKDKHRGYIN
jgi:transposase